MDYTFGEIIISPKTIYWIEMPFILSENDRIELLKKDILLINYSGESKEIAKLKKKDNKFSGYIFNLDGILDKNYIKTNQMYSYVDKLAKYIGNNFQKRSIVYTTMHDIKLIRIFKEYSAMFFEKDLNEKRNALSAVNNLIFPFFSKNNRVERTCLRLKLFQKKYYIMLTNYTKKKLMVAGILKDISLSGMGIIINEKDKLSKFNLKDLIEVKVSINKKVIHIIKAIIARIDMKTLEIGIMYNVLDPKMVDKNSSNYLTEIINNWITDIIKNM